MINSFNETITFLFYALYPLLLAYIYVNCRQLFLRSLLIPAVSFIAISIFRIVFDRPRPYETYPDMDPIILKDSKGHSMPSRHIFCCMIISMTVMQISHTIGLLLLLATVTEGFIRIIGGVHYPDDIAVGALLGIFAGMLYFI